MCCVFVCVPRRQSWDVCVCACVRLATAARHLANRFIGFDEVALFLNTLLGVAPAVARHVRLGGTRSCAACTLAICYLPLYYRLQSDTASVCECVSDANWSCCIPEPSGVGFANSSF